jgi:CHAT domain-containing protein
MALINLSNGLRAGGQLADATTTLAWANQLWQERDRQDLDIQRLEAALQLAVGNGHRARFEQELLARQRDIPSRSLALAAFAQATAAAEQTGQRNLAIAARLSALETHLTPLGPRVQVQPDGVETAAVAALNQQIQHDLAALPLGRARVYSPVQWAQGWLRLQERAQTQGQPGDRTWATLAPDPATLTATLDRAITDSRQLGDQRALAYALGAKGALAQIQGQGAIARQDTQAALELADRLAAAEIAYPLLWQLGRIERAAGDRPAAIRAYQAAVTTLRQLRSDLVAVSADIQFSFRESVEPIYRDLVDLLLTPEVAISPEHLRQARDTIEALQLAELDNFFQDACSLAKPVAADTVDPHAALIYTISLPDRLEVIAALPGGQLHHHRIPQSQTNLELTLLQARAAVTKQPITGIPTDLSALQTLYDGLVRPLEAELAARGIETLVFVLDSALRNLPVAALHDGDRFLIESYGVALTPGLQLLDPQPLTRQNLQTLTAGLTQARQGFDPLPGVEQELQQIGATVPTEMLLDETFTAAQFNAAVNRNPFQIVHVASHGEFSSNAANTFILTWDDRVNARDLDRLLSADVRQRHPIELLVLSACRTALGDNRAALGLAGVAVRAGARSTIASLWYVSDRATAELMAQFYATLAQSTTTKAAALRAAQRSLIHSPNFNAPYYWSAFVLVGNWL